MLAVIYCCYWTPKSQRCPGIDLIAINQERSKKELALSGELDSKGPFNAEIQEVKNQKITVFCYFLFPHQVFFPISTRNLWEISHLKSSENWQTPHGQKRPGNPELEKQTDGCPCPWRGSAHPPPSATCPWTGLESRHLKELQLSREDVQGGQGAAWREKQQRPHREWPMLSGLLS